MACIHSSADDMIAEFLRLWCLTHLTCVQCGPHPTPHAPERGRPRPSSHLCLRLSWVCSRPSPLQTLLQLGLAPSGQLLPGRVLALHGPWRGAGKTCPYHCQPQCPCDPRTLSLRLLPIGLVPVGPGTFLVLWYRSQEAASLPAWLLCLKAHRDQPAPLGQWSPWSPRYWHPVPTTVRPGPCLSCRGLWGALPAPRLWEGTSLGTSCYPEISRSQHGRAPKVDWLLVTPRLAGPLLPTFTLACPVHWDLSLSLPLS